MLQALYNGNHRNRGEKVWLGSNGNGICGVLLFELLLLMIANAALQEYDSSLNITKLGVMITIIMIIVVWSGPGFLGLQCRSTRSLWSADF